MANCQLNTNYPILDASSQQIRDIALTADGKTLEINLVPSGTNECTFSVDTAQGICLQIRGNNLRIVQTNGGLKTQLTDDPGKAKVKIDKDGAGMLRIIGIQDTVMGLDANLRYDSVTNKVVMEY